jgi:hypothetical protein
VTSGGLAAFDRNNYFYGMLMDVDRFQKDQTYQVGKRWLLNRLALGSGVMCGLAVGADPADPALLAIQPGVAIDGFGREIVVPAVFSVDATKLTDDLGNPAGLAPTGSVVLVSLLFWETRSEPVPVLVPDCHHPGACAPATVVEDFRILVRTAAGPPPVPAGCTLGPFPLPPEGALETLLAGKVSAACTGVPADSTVPLARVTLPGTIDSVSDRPLVCSNRLLFQLIYCLADRMAGVAGQNLLLYVSGDNQAATAGTPLPQPLIVALQDGAGNPVNGGTIVFTVKTGGGSVSATTAFTSGRYQAQWTLGAAGPQTVTASAAGTNLLVTFSATAT